ncbi:hypothetical protein BCV69DRAFT_283150 [Microstroma glucosiphilum]|uniref:Uncharacterized protein n=1 Tax=Pseudomicrostroma glucosiphilum TaxID=1684307 RepID=A0A316U614_9BASI|nr:hypothetical protein BCV69DRAFT_283150 [Pseudomicrostroma glucosiphilum]PWN20274.1 hypothetical protein BCV69DRAFT_283150 [Pseudomicrostroma glucosiphilum]
MSDFDDSDASSSYAGRTNHRRRIRSASIDSDDLGPSLADELGSGDEATGMSHSNSARDLDEVGVVGNSLQDELSGLDDRDEEQTGPSLGDELDFSSSGDGAATPLAPAQQGASLIEEQDDTARLAQRQAAYEATYASLVDSIQSTDAYLAALQATTSGDDTRVMEDLGRQAVLTLQESAQERAFQARELQDLVKSLDRDDGDALLAALAEIVTSDDKASLSFSRDGSSTGFASNGRSSSPDGMSPPSPVGFTQTMRHGSSRSEESSSSRYSALPPPGPSRKAPLPEHFAHLQVVTSSLVSSLQNLNEQTQVNQATFRESTKVLRKLRQQVIEASREMEVSENSQLWIESRTQAEEEEQKAAQSRASSGTVPLVHLTRGSGSGQAWCKGQTEEYERYLSHAALKAQQLLGADTGKAIAT